MMWIVLPEKRPVVAGRQCLVERANHHHVADFIDISKRGGVRRKLPTISSSFDLNQLERDGQRFHDVSSIQLRTNVTLTCRGCGQTFRVPPSAAKRQWCSARCRYATPGWQLELNPNGRKACVCATCGESFTAVATAVGKYCSRRCLGLANGQRKKPDPTKWMTYTCVTCGIAFQG